MTMLLVWLTITCVLPIGFMLIAGEAVNSVHAVRHLRTERAERAQRIAQGRLSLQVVL